MKRDTIAAIATAMSNSGIGIIRVSGDDSIDIVDCIYRDKNNNRVLKEYKKIRFIMDLSMKEKN